ncbi:hypothetical protein [Pelagibius sp.]|uniref:hypothetical protein n=1 Tax=Pelagibius sp. TaxID=1931238 RepID=UPI00262DA9BD|nr:hypothetical protein [Pelagibius sp.]
MLRRLIKLLVVLSVSLAVIVGLGLGAAALTTHYVFQEPALVTWSRYLKPEIRWQRHLHPEAGWAFDLIEGFLVAGDPRDRFAIAETARPLPGPEAWTSALVGPRVTGLGAEAPDPKEIVLIASVEDLKEAIRTARPGQVIQIQPGSYRVSERSIQVETAGAPDQPIVVRAAALGTARFEFDILEGFHVQAPHWIFENLVIEGICADDSACEHAFHVVGEATNVVIRNNWITNFNAAIKVNAKQGRVPDEGLILHNALINDRPRMTENPVAVVDIVAASRWRVQRNLIADFAKGLGDRVSYGAFFKGAGDGNVFEQNLVFCERRLTGGIRIGFSFGGEGTKPSVCRDGACAVEHQRGLARYNIIANCPHAAGVQLYKSADTEIHNNLLANTKGIDLLSVESDAVIANNVIDGRIMAHDGARASESHNVVSTLKAMLLDKVTSDIYADAEGGDFRLRDLDSFLDPGTPLETAGPDFCGQPYDPAAPAIGPIQYSLQMSCTPVIQ